MLDLGSINFGNLTKPATTLIEKISDGVGGIFRPMQIKRVAKAEAEASKIAVMADLEISEIQQRGLQRFIAEEGRKQQNIEAVTAKAISQLEASANPAAIDDDWIAHFFEKSRLVSDDEMQGVWSKVLAGEANSPGKYSKRTLEFLGFLDKSDAELFTKLLGFGWMITSVKPLIFNTDASIYKGQGITFAALEHLDDIGLISFSNLGFQLKNVDLKRLPVSYYGTQVLLDSRSGRKMSLDMGQVTLTKTGQELAPIAGAEQIPGFFDYVLDYWVKKGVAIASPLPNKAGYDNSVTAPPPLRAYP